MLKRALMLAAFGIGAASSASATTLNLEIWDVLAEVPTVCSGCASNPSVANQQAARASSTGVVDTELDQTGGSYLATVDAIIAANPTATLTGTFDPTTFPLNATTSVASLSIDAFFGTSFGGAGDNPVLGTIARMTGFVDISNGDMFNIFSDDGYRVTIGGEIFEVDQLQAPTSAPDWTYAGASGIQAIEILWFETQVTDAALGATGLEFTDPAPIPLPAAAWMLLAGIGGIAAVGRRRRTAA